MMTVAIPRPTLSKHLRQLCHWFRLANSHPDDWWKKQLWYPLKSKLLRRYAECDGYDVQNLDRKCWSCHGSGQAYGGRCNDCGGTGIYFKRRVILERWRMPDGSIYHCPTDAVSLANIPPSQVRDQIAGLIHHPGVTTVQATRAAHRIMRRHDPDSLARSLNETLDFIDTPEKRLAFRQCWRSSFACCVLRRKFPIPDPSEFPF